MDFNTQRRAAAAVENFGRKTKVFYPVCLLLKIIIIGIGNLTRAVDMALSDDDGRLLGLNRKCEKRERRSRIRAEKEKRVNAKALVPRRGFFFRALSGLLACAFTFMILPTGLEIVSFAVADPTYAWAKISDLDIETLAVYDESDPSEVVRYRKILKGFSASASGLKAISGGDGIWNEIGENAFANCADLYAIDLSSAEAIGTNAFSGASGLKRIIIDGAKVSEKGKGYFGGIETFSGLDPDVTFYVKNTDNTMVMSSMLTETMVNYNIKYTAKNENYYITQMSSPDDIAKGSNGEDEFKFYAQKRIIPDSDSLEGKREVSYIILEFNIGGTGNFDGIEVYNNDGDIVSWFVNPDSLKANAIKKTKQAGQNEYKDLQKNNTGTYYAVIENANSASISSLGIRTFNAVSRIGSDEVVKVMDGNRQSGALKIYGTPPGEYKGAADTVNSNTPVAYYDTSMLEEDASLGSDLAGSPKGMVSGIQSSDSVKYFICYDGNFGDLTNDHCTNDIQYYNKNDLGMPITLKSMGAYNAYLIEVYDPTGAITVDPNNLQDAANQLKNLNYAKGVLIWENPSEKDAPVTEWRDVTERKFSYRLIKFISNIEPLEPSDVSIIKNADCGNSITFKWHGEDNDKIAGYYFRVYDGAGTRKVYEKELPQFANKGKDKNYELTLSFDDVNQYNILNNSSFRLDEETDKVYFDIIPYLRTTENVKTEGKGISRAAGGIYEKVDSPYVTVDHYKLRTVSKLENGKSVFKLFWSVPEYSDENIFGFNEIRDYSDYGDTEGFEISYRIGNTQGSVKLTDVNADFNGVTNEYSYVAAAGTDLTINTDYTFTVRQITGSEENSHFYSSRFTYSKAKPRPAKLNRDDITMEPGASEFYLTWKEIDPQVDAYMIDVYRVNENVLDKVGPKVQHVHREIRAATADGLIVANQTLENDPLYADEHILHSQDGYYSLTIDSLNLMGGARPFNNVDYMVDITGINYGLGMNYLENQIDMPCEIESTIPKSEALPEDPEKYKYGFSRLEDGKRCTDYEYRNIYHYEIVGDSTRSADVVVPINTLIITDIGWIYSNNLNERGIRISWQLENNSGVDSYRIERVITSADVVSLPTNQMWNNGLTRYKQVKPGEIVDYYDDTEASVIYDNIKNKGLTKFWYRVTPMKDNNPESPSVAGWYEASKDLDVHIAPPITEVSQTEDKRIVIRWKKSIIDNADGYNIYDEDGNIIAANINVPSSMSTATIIVDGKPKTVTIKNYEYIAPTENFNVVKNYKITSLYYISEVRPEGYDVSDTFILYESFPSYVTGVTGTLKSPTNVNATTLSNSSVSVSWTPVEEHDILYYIYYYTDNKDNPNYKTFMQPKDIYDEDGNLITCVKVIDGLEAGETYTFFVRTAKYVLDDNEKVNIIAQSLPSNEDKAVVGFRLNAPSISVEPGNGKLTVSWTHTDNADGYVVYRNSNGEYEEVTSVKGNVNSWVDYRVKNGQDYRYMVKAYRYENGVRLWSDYSVPAKETPSSQIDNGDGTGDINLSKPLFSVKKGDGKVTITWSAIPYASGYRVYRSTNENSGFKCIANTFGTEYADREVTNGVTYYYYVTAVSYGVAKESGHYDPVSATPNDDYYDPADDEENRRLSAPVILTCTTDDGTVTLTWTEVEGADGYEIYGYSRGIERADTFSYGPDPMKTVPAPQTSYTFTGLTNGVTYTFAVVAYRSYGNNKRLRSGYSDPATIKVGSNVINLKVPADFTVSSGDGTAILSWKAVSGATGYEIWEEDENKRLHMIGSTENTSYTITGLRNGDTHTYTVCAYYIDSNNEYHWSNYVSPYRSVKVGGNIQLPRPMDLIAEGGDSSIALTWTEVKGASGYEVYRVNSDGSVTYLTDASSSSKVITGLQNGTKYTYTVRAFVVDASGKRQYSEYSASASATAGSNLYKVPTPLDFNVTTSDGSAVLSWKEVDGADGYEVHQVNADGSTSWLADPTTAGVTFPGLKNGEVYTYAVRAFKRDAYGNRIYSSFTNPKSITVGTYLAAPVDVVATAGNRSVTLDWSAVTGATGYVIYAYNAAANTFTAVGVVSKPGFVQSGLENGLTYTYMIAAYKTVGLSNQYSQYSLAVSAVPHDPSAETTNPNQNNNNNINNNNNNNNNNNQNGSNLPSKTERRINIVGTVPYGISHAERISAFTDEMAFSKDIDIRFSVNSESTKAVYDVLAGYAEGLESFDIYPFDISAYEAGTNIKIQPAPGHYLTITMPVADSFKKYGEDFQLMHVLSNGKMEIIPLTFGESEGITLIQFSVSEFSPFAFVHYYSPEDLHSRSGAAATGASGAAMGSVYSMRFNSAAGFLLRKRNRIYKLIKKQ